MKKPAAPEERVQRFLAKRARNKAKGWDFSDAPESRQKAKVTLPMESIVWALELGMVSNQPTLRDVETLNERLGSWARTLVPKSISDTTLDTEVRRLSPDYLLEKLALRVRDLYRSKMLNPVGLPCGLATVDGKNLATLEHDAQGTGQARSSDNDKWHRSKEQEAKRGKDYYLMLALRATLTSAEAKPCIYTMGTAVWALGLLRLLAYNTVQLLRRRRLRNKNTDGSLRAPMSWRSLFKVIEDALKLDREAVPVG